MRVQGYIEIDYQVMDDATFELFNEFMRQYTVHYKRVHRGDREYYFCIIRDHSRIEDQITEDGTVIPGLLTLLADRNPVINGLWQIDGTAYGVVKTTEIDPETGLEVVSLTGEPGYGFDLDIHLTHTPTDKTYDEDGNLISETEVIEFKHLHGFAGWDQGTYY